MTTFPSPSLELVIAEMRRNLDVPGLGLAVVKDDQVIYARGFGLRTLGQPEPVDEHTTFAIASISKSFTSASLAMLVDEGRLRWDDPLEKYLPGFRLMDDFATREMRVRDLLIHDSGLPEVSGGTIWYGSDLSREEVTRRLRYLRPVSSFRASYAYQNVMYLAAGMVVQAITGGSWDDFVQARIFDPLGMRDSAANLVEALKNPNRATPYSSIPYASTGPVQAIPYRNHDNAGPAASIHASAWDLAQYLRMHLNNGSYEDQELISAKSCAELHTPQVVIPLENVPPVLQPVWARFTTYALGWRVQDYRGRKMVQHSGGVDGMRTLVSMLPEQRLGVVALTNLEAPLTYPVTYRVLDELLGEAEFDWGGAYLGLYREAKAKCAVTEQARLAEHLSGTRPSQPPNAYTGRYLSSLVDAVEISAENGRLVLRFAHTPAFTADLDHWHHDTFRLTWRDPYIPWGLVTFALDSRGQVHSLTFDQPALLDVDFNELGALEKAS